MGGEKIKHNPRKPYVVMWAKDAVEAGYIDPTYTRYDDYFNVLLKTSDNGPPTLVGCDGGEPEDQTLNRDWSWVVTELNDLAHEIHERQLERDELAEEMWW